MTIEVSVPDIGDFKDVPVIEVLVKAGDRVNAEDPLVTLESDKATLEVPAPAAGTVKLMRVKVGDKVSQGSPILVLDSAGGKAQDTAAPASAKVTPAPSATQAPMGIAEVRIPDIGAFPREWLREGEALAIMHPDIYQALRAQGLPMQLVHEDPRRVLVRKP